MELRDVLKMMRGELGINQAELANALHVSFSSVSRWETGKTCPNRSVLAVLSEYACSCSVSSECRALLDEAINGAKKTKIAPAKDHLFAVEHASLSQLIDDASFPIYVCDLETDELLYLNHKTAAMLGGTAEKFTGRKCYECLMRRDLPCIFCHKEELTADRFTTFQAFDPQDNTYHLVQGKLLQWNGRKAQVRYIIDKGSALEATTKSGREAAYAEQLHLRRELAGDAMAVAHYNLTHDTVSDVVSRNEEYARFLSAHSIDDLLSWINENLLSDEDRQVLENIRDRKSMIQQFYAGKTHITVRHLIGGLGGIFEGTFDLMQNPVTYDIEVFAQLHDVTATVMMQEVAVRLFNIDYETITTIDVATGEARPYIGSHIHDVITEQKSIGDNIAGVEAYLRKYCADDDVASVIKGTSLPYVIEQLADKTYYHITYSLRLGDKTIYKRAVYTYLDNRKAIILCAMQNLTDLHAMENAKRNQLAEALQALQEQGGMDIARYDLQTGTFYSNSAMATAVGYGSVIENVPEEFIARGLVAPAFVTQYREFYEKLRQGEGGILTVPCKVGDGSMHWIRIDAQLLYDKDKQPYQAILAFRDVDEEREQATVYKKWRQSLVQKKPENYTLFRSNLNRDTSYDKVEGKLLNFELFDHTLTTINERTRSYASRFVHIDDFDAYTALLNTENLLAGYYRGTHRMELSYRERVTADEYRPLHLTVEMAQYHDSPDIELFALYEPGVHPEKTELTVCGNSNIVFGDTGVVLINCDWPDGNFDYDPAISRYILGRYDDRPIWEVFMADQVADAQDIKGLQKMVHELAATPERSSGTMNLLLKTPGGARHWFMVNAYKRANRQTESGQIVLAVLDINDEVLTNEKLRFQAEHDNLTGLYNRTTFLKLVTEAVQRKPANSYILLCSDINDFGFFNIRYGREEGDRLLRYAAERLRVFAAGKNSFAGRLSNDVFALLLPNTAGVLDRAEAVVRGYFDSYPLNVKITGRAGVCFIADPGMKADTMLDMAATAKEAIKGKYGKWLAVFDQSMNERHLREKYITDRMEIALVSGQFDVYIQPQFHHGTGQIVGAEALVRWHDPERGVVLPGEFIPVFEKTGFITRMDEYIWDQAAGCLSAWMAQGHTPVPISVNVSREDINDPDLCRKLLAITEKHNVPTRIFHLEITESLFAENPQRLTTVVAQLHEAGFLIEMDDFGSGYSSLNVLKDVPVDVLKLDMRFFSGTDNLGRGGMIINAVMRMSRWLGIPVIAEGVELQEQADFLLSVGCPTIQGYLYEKPLPAKEFERRLVETGWNKAIPQNVINSEINTHSFWNPLSADSQLFNNYIGPAFIFEYHDGEYEIVRMNRRFIDTLQISETVMLPARGLIHFCEEDRPKVKKAVLEALYANNDVKVALRCLRADGSTPLFQVTLRVVARSADRALLFAVLDT